MKTLNVLFISGENDEYPEFIKLFNEWVENTAHFSITTKSMQVPEWYKLINYCQENKKEFARFALKYLDDIGGNRSIMMIIDTVIGHPSIFAEEYADPKWKSVIKVYKDICNNFLNDTLVVTEDGYIDMKLPTFKDTIKKVFKII